ncbi:hypothetical protein DFH08DRAFT_1012152 [Mycena albidolilacea]|uniref:Uncharacterized protein n=1 Tax=Mycena albidolilacea TaxID=1033008 RepID=A0AAD6ZWW1_9AGAR|nr:hypothetical protein DFH08DRAFT_1012152 [Mycena albidolilacea]
MPTRNACRQALDALEQAFLINLITELEAQEYKSADSDSDSLDSSSDDSWSSSSSSSDDSDEEMTAADDYIHSLAKLYSQRYLATQEEIPKSTEFLDLLLHEYKVSCPELFHSYLRIELDCFDSLVATISDDPVFHNNSNNPQMPVNQQAAIALYHLGISEVQQVL